MLALAMVLVLGAMGVGFAKWSETIVVTGSVSTGDVSIELEHVSGTWVYKMLDETCNVKQGVGDSTSQIPAGGDTYPGVPSPLAYAEVDNQSGAPNVLHGQFVNLFPLVEPHDYVIDLLYHYTGSVPVKIDVDAAGLEVTPATLAACARVEMYRTDITGTKGPDGTGEPELITAEATQLHNCDYILILIIIDGQLIQDAVTIDVPIEGIASGTFSYQLMMEQWNEYGDDYNP
jgi:hypothetical protein